MFNRISSFESDKTEDKNGSLKPGKNLVKFSTLPSMKEKQHKTKQRNLNPF